MISEPFLHIEIILFEHSPTTETPEPATKKVIARLQPCEIASYHPGFHFGSMIVLKNGSMMMTEHPCEAIDHNIAAYWKQVQAILDKEKKPTIQTFQ